MISRSPGASERVEEPPGRTNRGERADAARNRRAILSAAHRLILESGVDRVSMDDIAAAAGVGKGTLFRRFGDREGLIVALFDQLVADWEPEALARLTSGERPALDRALAFLVEIYDNVTIPGRPLLRALASCPGHQRLDRYFTWHTALTQVIAEARPESPAAFHAHALLATLRTDLVDLLADEAGMGADEIRAGLIDFIHATLTGRPAPEGYWFGAGAGRR